ncbi:hypothetical protein HZ326_12087 [Fusarium oxysporum f. sp. albedinis]|nr:hypothetical protein HZ326_12087 [Fusarium oxysporum f. sp. albedinis]
MTDMSDSDSYVSGTRHTRLPSRLTSHPHQQTSQHQAGPGTERFGKTGRAPLIIDHEPSTAASSTTVRLVHRGRSSRVGWTIQQSAAIVLPRCLLLLSLPSSCPTTPVPLATASSSKGPHR